MRLWVLIGIVAGALALGLAACGGDDNGNGAEAPPPAPEEQPAEREQPEAAEKIAVEAEPGGGLEFKQESLSADAGKVTFELVNDASIPHDLSIEKDGELVDQTDTITSSKADLTVDLEPGEYTFYCSVPGHRPGGMEGKLTVK